MEYVIQTPEDRAAITELPITALQTNPALQNRNVGMKKHHKLATTDPLYTHVTNLAEDIRRIGQQVPIKVVVADETDSTTTEKFWVVDGHHRLKAVQRLKMETIKVEVVQGARGFEEAQVASRRSNREIKQALTDSQRTENAWAALNLPLDTFRRMTLEEQSKELGISIMTLRRMRQAIREEAIQRGAIDMKASKTEKAEQLMAFWQGVTFKYSHVPWSIHRVNRRGAGKTPPDGVLIKKLKKELVQTALGHEGQYTSDVLYKALKQLLEESKKGTRHLIQEYKPHLEPAYHGEEEDLDSPDLTALAQGEDF